MKKEVKIVSVPDIARALGLSVQAVDLWIRGGMPFIVTSPHREHQQTRVVDVRMALEWLKKNRPQYVERFKKEYGLED